MYLGSDYKRPDQPEWKCSQSAYCYVTHYVKRDFLNDMAYMSQVMRKCAFSIFKS